MNGRFKKDNYNIIVTAQHKSKETKMIPTNKRNLVQLVRTNFVIYAKTNKLKLHYYYGKRTMPALNKN
jgi:hypothetical protein